MKNELEWRVRVVMAERRIKTITELRQRLTEIGVDISTTQLGRVLDNLPNRLSMDLLAGLTTVLHCQVGDLLWISPSSGPSGTMPTGTPRHADPEQETPRRLPPQQHNKATRRTAAASRPAADTAVSVTGPKVTSLPLPQAGPRRT
ncbi:helix-turn-helix domain-containing protein [Acidithiobacillus sp. AC3]